MPCFKPLNAWVSSEDSLTGKKTIAFANYGSSPVESRLKLPCGRCIGCRLDRSRSWAIRCLKEAEQHQENCFITLTYNERNLPEGATLVKKHFQDFMKRFRKAYPDKKIRFFHAGEYGSEWQQLGGGEMVPIEGTIGRPHYHAIIFNHDFEDKIFYSKRNDVPLYISPKLQKIWGKGFSSVGTVTFESAAYVARYIMKKVTGDQADSHYQQVPATEEFLKLRVSPFTGEIYPILPEYTTMSRKPGIGKDWIDKYMDEVFPDDFVVVKGKKMPVPQYFRQIYQERDPEAAERLAKERLEKAKTNPDNSRKRLSARLKVAEARSKMLPRNLNSTRINQ